MDKRMITTDVTEEDLPLEGNLRPQTLDEYIGQENNGTMRWIMYCFTVLPDLVKPPYPASLPMRWVHT